MSGRDCPRCGESQPAGATATDGVLSSPVAPAPTRPLSNAQIGRAVLGGMASIACLTLAYALATTSLRRANDHKSEAAVVITADDEPPPVRWPTLGYVPDRVNLAVALRVAELAGSPAGRSLLDRFGHDGTIFQLPWSDVRELTIAGDLTVLPPRFVAVVRTVRPIDPAVVKTLWGTRRGGRTSGKPIDRFPLKLGPIELDVGVWQPDSSTLVIAQADDFPAIPAKASPVVGRCPVALTRLIEQNLPARPSAWLVADLPAEVPGASALNLPTGRPAESVAPWAAVRRLALAVPEGGVGPIAVRASGDASAIARWFGELPGLTEVQTSGEWVTAEAGDVGSLIAAATP